MTTTSTKTAVVWFAAMLAESAGIAPPEPRLTADEMLERARALRPVLRTRQALCEQLGRIPDETNSDFVRAGFYRMLQPRLFGGYEFSLVDFIRVMSEVSRGCSESGWVLALTAGHTAAFLAGFPEQAQSEAYGSTGDVRIPGVALPGGTAIPGPDGYRISGAWDYASGCDVATHFLGAVMVLDAETKQPRSYAYVLLDASMYTIVDNWNVVGMQGTGSKRIVAAEQIVATHRVQPFADATTMTMTADQPGRRMYVNPLFHGPIVPLLLTELGAVAVGTARGALDLYDELLRSRKSPVPPFAPAFESPHHQHHFGHAQGWVDTAEAALLHLGLDYLRMGEQAMRGSPPGLEEQRRYQRVIQNVLELCWSAVDLIFRSSGSSVAKQGSMLARTFKNLAVIRTHVTMQEHTTSINVGRLHFELAPLSAL